jgi:hypothetical protein
MSDWYNKIEKEAQDYCKHKWVLVAQNMRCDYCGITYEVK